MEVCPVFHEPTMLAMLTPKTFQSEKNKVTSNGIWSDNPWFVRPLLYHSAIESIIRWIFKLTLVNTAIEFLDWDDLTTIMTIWEF